MSDWLAKHLDDSAFFDCFIDCNENNGFNRYHGNVFEKSSRKKSDKALSVHYIQPVSSKNDIDHKGIDQPYNEYS